MPPHSTSQSLRPSDHSSIHLPAEILDLIFRSLRLLVSQRSPQGSILEDNESILARTTLVHACLVSKGWYFSAASALWTAPVFPSIHGFLRFGEHCRRVAKDRRLRTTNTTTTPWIGSWGLENMRVLDVRGTRHLSDFIVDDHVLDIADARPPLQDIRFHDCRNLTDVAVVSIVAAADAAAATGLGVRRLDITGCRRITDAAVQMVALLCEDGRLEDVRLRNVPLVSDHGVMALARHLGRSLKVCDLGHCTRISDLGVLELVSAGLGHGNDHGHGEGRGTGTGTGTGILTRLSLTHCTNITRSAFPTVVETLMSHNPNLTHLELSTPDSPRGSVSIRFPFAKPFPVIRFLVGPNTGITTLHLEGARHLNDGHILHIARTLGGRLLDLVIGDAANVSETALKTLVRAASKLGKLGLRRLPGVTGALLNDRQGQEQEEDEQEEDHDDAKSDRGEWGNHLVHLDLTGCRTIRDVDIVEFFCGSADDLGPHPCRHHVRSLNLSGCPHITLFGVMTLATSSVPLVELVVDGKVVPLSLLALDATLERRRRGRYKGRHGGDWMGIIPDRVGVEQQFGHEVQATWVDTLGVRELEMLREFEGTEEGPHASVA
ncbi:hypothetical protein HKX48_009189 [Thoreauomyces humboldtii]|nr:hypothetical protein HKX48_009189 [Thoreauomyces humboldtii]